MQWLTLYTAIALEVMGTTALRFSEGMARWHYFVGALALWGISLALLALALKTIPIGVAYAIWSGIGTLFIVVIGIVWFGEATSALRFLFIAMIVAGAIGLNLTTGARG